MLKHNLLITMHASNRRHCRDCWEYASTHNTLHNNPQPLNPPEAEQELLIHEHLLAGLPVAVHNLARLRVLETNRLDALQDAHSLKHNTHGWQQQQQ
jgi:hypothetical protein